MTKRTDSPSAAVRIRVMKRDKFTCQYCGVNGSEAELEIDHIIPFSKGGSHHPSNLTTACRSCNQEKGDKPKEVLAKNRQTAATPNKSEKHILHGMFFHTYKEGEVIQFQAQIVGVDGEIVLAQLFEWFMGEPTEVGVFDKSFIYSEHCKLYRTKEAWLHAYEKYARKRRAKEESDAIKTSGVMPYVHQSFTHQ